MAAARVPGAEAAAEVGRRVRDALYTRHGRRLYPVLRAVVYDGSVPLPGALGPPHRRRLVHTHLRQQGLPRHA